MKNKLIYSTGEDLKKKSKKSGADSIYYHHDPATYFEPLNEKEKNTKKSSL
jgi:hypothetical protein